MNVDTGKLRMLSENEEPLLREVMMNMDDLTDKQKKEMQVSLKDNRSKAGIKRIEHVKKNPLTKNQCRNIRKKLRDKK